MSQSNPPNYIPSLDGLRAVSIAIVFAGHAGVSRLIPGGFGVTVFFFLSGFLITTLFVKELEKYGDINLKAFFLRRLLRLSPPLFVSLFLIYMAVALGISPGDLDPVVILSQIFYLFNYTLFFGWADGNGAAGTTVLWSLAVEEHFYMIWPFIFWAISRKFLGLPHVVALLVAILVWRSIRTLVFGHSEWDVYITTDTRFDSILYGCLLALMNWKGVSERLFPKSMTGMLLVLAAAGAVILFTLVFRDPVFRSTIRYSFQGIALLVVFYYAVSCPNLIFFKPLNWGWVRRLGLYSYTVYLVHHVIIETLIYQGVPERNVPVILGVSLLISVIYADLLLRFIEAPVKRIRERLSGH